MNRVMQKNWNMSAAVTRAAECLPSAANFAKALVFVCLATISGISAAANICTSKASANWNVASTWNSCGSTYPQTGDTVIIANNVSLNTSSNNIASLTINSGEKLTVSGTGTNNLTVSGTFTNSGGTFTGSTGTVSIGGTFTSSGTFTGGSGAVAITGTFTNSGPFTGGTSPYSIGGSFTNSGTFSSGTGIWTFNGSAAQSVSGAVTFGSLTDTNSAGVTFISNITVSTLLTVNSGATLTVSGADTLTVSGSLSNAGTFVGGTGAMSLAGNYTNTGTFTSGSGTWTLNGAAAQTITGTATFTNLTVNNTSGGVTLSNNVTVSTLMKFTAGDIITGTNTLTLSAVCPASTSGASSTSYVDGNLQLTFPAAAVTCVFPVGDATVYAPITVTVPNFTGIAGGTLTGSSTPGEAPQFATSGIDATQDANRYWTLGVSGDTFTSFPSGGSYNVTLQFASSDVSGGTVTNFEVALYNGAWSTLAGSASGTTATLTGLTSFGVLAVGTPLAACLPPSNIPTGLSVSCECDNFTRSTLNPSTIFGGSWQVSSSSGTFGVPRIVTSGYLELTDNSGGDATAATVPGIFPAAGNYISVEFKHYAFNGSGADGMAVTLSDYAVPANPGAFGGSLGFAQKCQNGVNGCSDDCTTSGGCPGFAGGWIGMALDEYGNYSDSTEGRVLGPGFDAQSVGLRGPGSGQNGYRWEGGDLAVGGIANASSTTPATGNMYQIIVDARNYSSGQILVYANRDSTTQNGTNYVNLFGGTSGFNAYTEASYAQGQGWITSIIPANWQVSFTGSTGGLTDIHEISGLRICAQSSLPPTSGNSSSNFNAIDSYFTLPNSYTTASTAHIYTKVVGLPFTLGISAFNGSAINTVYTQTVLTQLIDDSSGTTSCNANPESCNACSKPVIGSQSVNFANATTHPGQIETGNFTVTSAYSRVIARMCQTTGNSCSGSTAIGCSKDAFTVRPTGFSSVTSSATNSNLTGTPVFNAGTIVTTGPPATAFSLGVTTTTPNYTGTPQIDNANDGGVQGTGTNWAAGTFNPAYFPTATVSSSPSPTSTGTFAYSEVGNITFKGYNPASDTTSPRGIYDAAWVSGTPNLTSNSQLQGSSDSTGPDCVVGGYSNVANASDMYGCNFGIIASTATYGRFVPDHFVLLTGSTYGSIVTPAITGGTPNFTYMDQPIPVIKYYLNACAASSSSTCAPTTNYSASITPIYPTSLPVLVAEDLGNPGYNFGSRISLPSTLPTWSGGLYSFDSTTSVFSPPGTRPGGLPSASVTNAGGPFDQLELGVNMTDADGAVLTPYNMTGCGSGCTGAQIGSATSVREGRMVLSNAYGSELLTLPVTVSTQYYNATQSAWLLNTADTGAINGTGTACNTGCTFIVKGGAVTSGGIGTNGGSAPNNACFVGGPGSTTCVTSPAMALVSGTNTYYVYDGSPHNQGTVDMAVNLNSGTADISCNANHPTSSGSSETWLQYPWCGTIEDPNARLKFGSSKVPYIYLREMY